MEQRRIIQLLEMLNVGRVYDRYDWVSSSCPFAKWLHEDGRDRHPSFGISIGATSYYHCFACGKKGPLIKLPFLLEKLSGRSYAKERRFIIKNEGLFSKGSENTVTYANDIPETILEKFEPFRGTYRGLTRKTIELADLRYDKEENRIIFPFRDSMNRLVGIRGRYIGDDDNVLRYREYSEFTPSSLKKCGIWYGMQWKLDPNKLLVLVEGEIDCLMLRQAGIKNVWAAIGASITRMQIASLKKTTNGLLLFFDDNKAGWTARDNILHSCKGLFPIYSITEYHRCVDADEAVRKGVIKKVLKSKKRY